MVNITLKPNPKNPYEGLVCTYLKEFASPALAKRINEGTKTLAQCWNYVTSEARKQAKNGCACIADDAVYGWIMHFFEEDEIKGEAYDKAQAVKVATSETAEEKPEPKIEKVTAKPKRAKEAAPGLDQISFESLFG